MTRPPLTWGCLFDGIHGFGLGIAAAGAGHAAWTVEAAPFPRRILEQRIPDAQHLADIRDVHHPPKAHGLTGGFPCQDLSVAGLGHGITGSRSGLWTEYARIISEVEPEVVLIENVPALLHRGMELVVANLIELGYGVEWDCLPAAAFGAPHLRDRVWIVAHHLGQPSIFGQPAALFPTPPGQAADLVGGDSDDDDTPTAWQRWPRAGWVHGDPALVMALQPLAPLRDVKTNGARVPTPTVIDATLAAKGKTGTSAPGTGGRHALQLSHMANRGDLNDADVAHHAGQLLPTPVASDASGSRNAAAHRPNGNGRHHAGTTLLDYLILNGDAPMPPSGRWPTPRASSGDSASGGGEGGTYVRTPSQQAGTHGRYLQTEAFEATMPNATAEERQAAGGLNPTWVEWLMGFPLGWTDPDTPNDQLRAHPWHHGEPPGIPRVAPNIPHRRERLTALGNALIPPAPAWLASRYLAARHHALADASGQHPIL